MSVNNLLKFKLVAVVVIVAVFAAVLSIVAQSSTRRLQAQPSFPCLAYLPHPITPSPFAICKPTVRIVRLEVTQGVQDWNNSLTLVRNRRTVVRAFMETYEGQKRELTAELKGAKYSADNTALFVDTIDPVNPGQSITVMPDVTERRGDIDASLNFVLPKHWTDLGADEDLLLELVFEPYSNTRCLEGTKIDLIENRCLERIEFTEVRLPTNIYMVPIPVEDVTGDSSGSIATPSDAHLREQFLRIKSLMPLSDQIFNVVDETTLDNILKEIDEKDKNFDRNESINVALKAIRTAAGSNSSGDVYLGILLGNSDIGNSGIGEIGGNYAVWFTDGLDFTASTGWSRNRGPHEFGHILGEYHAANSDKKVICDTRHSTAADKTYDYINILPTSSYGNTPVATLGPVDSTNINVSDDVEVWGMDTRFVNLSTVEKAYVPRSLFVPNPYDVFSVMSYCRDARAQNHGSWIDAFHHEEIIKNISITNSRFSNDGVVSGSTVSRVPSYHFSGSVFLSSSGEATSVELNPIFMLTEQTEIPRESGDLLLELRDTSDNIVRSISFQAFEPIDETLTSSNIGEEFYQGSLSETQRKASFSILAVDPPEFSKFSIVASGKEIFSADRSPNIPSISITGPTEGQKFESNSTVNISWTGIDSDNDNLVYNLYYSTDGGHTYMPLFLDAKGSNENFDTDRLRGSYQARIGISVSDGTRTSFAETPIFTVEGHTPRVYIDTPFSGAVFAEKQGFILEAWGIDKDDGGLPSHAFSWTSNIDGNLGTGSFLVLSADDLTLGDHTITVTVTDSDNLTAIANVNITISDRNMLPVANDDKAFGGFEEALQIDVLANDIDTEGDFDLSTLTIDDQPQLGIVEVSYTTRGLPVIEYSPITGGEDSFSYYICDGLYRCDSAEVTVVFPDCTITGTRGSDNLVGTPGDDVICGLDGDDFIDGKAGNDLIYAGFGEDVVAGRTGDDTIYGGPGNDLILGHRGDDTIYGGPSNDRLYGGGGNDVIYGGEETDEVYGEADNDILYGNDGPDKIHGGQGDDTIYGGDGDDTIRGNAGADIIYSERGFDALFGVSEEDTVIDF